MKVTIQSPAETPSESVIHTHRLYFYSAYRALQCYPAGDSEAQEMNINFRTLADAKRWADESGYEVIDKQWLPAGEFYANSTH